VPAFWVFSRLRGRRAWLAGWLVGASAELAIYYWLPGTVERYGGLPRAFAAFVWFVFAFGTGIYVAVFAWGFARVRAGCRRALAAGDRRLVLRSRIFEPADLRLPAGRRLVPGPTPVSS
jgi:hypothetical protein